MQTNSELETIMKLFLELSIEDKLTIKNKIDTILEETKKNKTYISPHISKETLNETLYSIPWF